MTTLATAATSERGVTWARARPAALTRALAILSILVVLLALATVVAAAHGPAGIGYDRSAAVLLHRAGLDLGVPYTVTEQRIIEQIRLPRIVAAALVGMALATAGAVMQGLFRNPLADPAVLGVSNGGALGAVIAIATGAAGYHALALPLAALAGALATALLVYGLAVRRHPRATATLILAGVAVGSLLSSVTTTIVSLTDDRDQFREILFWLLGGLDNRGWSHVELAAAPILLGTLACIGFARELNAMLFGEESAHGLGVSVPVVRLVLLGCASLITGAAVAISGIISFVGLVVPHLLRLLLGPDHRLLLPAAAVGGALFVVVADTIGRLIMQPAEVRVGIMTSFIGAPFFLFLLLRSRREVPEL